MPGRGETAASAPTINALQRLVATAGTASRIRCIGREQRVPSHPTDRADNPPQNVCEARAAGDHLHHRPIKIGEKKAPTRVRTLTFVATPLVELARRPAAASLAVQTARVAGSCGRTVREWDS